MSSHSPTPHFFKILPRKTSYSMPMICVHCGKPAEQYQGFSVSQIHQKDKIRTTLELYFPLCHDCGTVAAKCRKSDKISSWISVGLALIPATVFIVMGIASKGPINPTVLLPLIFFAVVYCILRFLIRPLSRIFIPASDRSTYRQIKKSVKIFSFDQFMVNFEFSREDFANMFESLNKSVSV